MTGTLSKVRTVFALGLLNMARVITYRLGVGLRLNPVTRLKAETQVGPFFQELKELPAVKAPKVSAWGTSGLLFSHWPLIVGNEAPDWLVNPFTKHPLSGTERDWWKIPDFDPAVGDIKLIWELSRFDWALPFAQKARQGDSEFLTRLNYWIVDWCKHNPPYKGPNWKCAQEASIRVMNLAMVALILGQVTNTETSLRDLVRLHLQRIAPTLQYAIAQDNNHGTSEAVALFVGGSWLAHLGVEEGSRWAAIGRRWLENRASRLVGLQGSFSQHSLNYHRLMLDTFCIAEVWRRQMELPAFSKCWQSRMRAATEWLWSMVNPLNGDGPNLGANDGARLLQLSNTSYRDYRPSVQLGMALFVDKRAYGQPGPWDQTLQWLGVELPSAVLPFPTSYLADDGGFAILRRGNAMAMLRYPRFRFRPSQADVLHLDFWLGKDNLLRDAGTYSYNTDSRWINYFGGTVSHNTVQFDGRDQMPRLSRFLLGDWLSTEHLQPLQDNGQVSQFTACYRDRKGIRHQRHVSLQDFTLKIVDDVQGFASDAVLRWRLMPGDWKLEKTLYGSRVTLCEETVVIVLNISASVPIIRCELVQGWESHHYLEKTPLPVLEVEVREPGTLTTHLHWTV